MCTGKATGKIVPVHAIKVYGGVKLWLYSLLTSAIKRGEWSASHLGRFTPEESAPGTHRIGGWVGPTAGLHVLEKEEIFCESEESISDSSFVHAVF
jgi:hypothetical protein